MKDVHHAILYRADLVSELELPTTGNLVEVDNLFIERFGVDDARELVRKANNRPVEASHQLLVVRTNFITLEAQNALLKILEEPPVSTRFAFVVPHDFVVLATLISRFSRQDPVRNSSSSVENEVFKTFFEQDYKERLANIEQSLKRQDVSWQRSIKQGLIQYLSNRPEALGNSLQALEYVTRLLLTRGASNKMLLEHVALTLPTR